MTTRARARGLTGEWCNLQRLDGVFWGNKRIYYKRTTTNASANENCYGAYNICVRGASFLIIVCTYMSGVIKYAEMAVF